MLDYLVHLCVLLTLFECIFRFAPISSDWLNTNGTMRDKDNAATDGFGSHSEEQLQLSSMMLSGTVLDIETERLRLVERAVESSFAIDGEVQDERSLLYSHPSHSPIPTRTRVPVSATTASASMPAASSAIACDALHEKVMEDTDLEVGADFGTDINTTTGSNAGVLLDPLEFIRSQMDEQVSEFNSLY